MGGVKLSRLKDYKERINGLKMELFHTSQSILALDHTDRRLTGHESSIGEKIFRVHEHIRDLLNSIAMETPVQADPPREESKVPIGLKLPKFCVPTFDGDMMNWSNFWDLFSVLIHDKKELSNTKKIGVFEGCTERRTSGSSH